MRISASLETKLPKESWPAPHAPVRQTRLKERYKYKFQYLVFDLTKTETVNQFGQKQDPQYEVEVEIDDLAHLYKNLSDFGIFHKVIRRFVQNLASVTAIVAWLEQGAVALPPPSIDPIVAFRQYQKKAS